MRPWLLWASVSAIALSAVVAVLLQGCRTLGAEPADERKNRMSDSPQWSKGRFVNEEPMWTNTRSGLLHVFESTPGDVPDAPIPVVMDGGKGLSMPAASGLR